MRSEVISKLRSFRNEPPEANTRSALPYEFAQRFTPNSHRPVSCHLSECISRLASYATPFVTRPNPHPTPNHPRRQCLQTKGKKTNKKQSIQHLTLIKTIDMLIKRKKKKMDIHNINNNNETLK